MIEHIYFDHQNAISNVTALRSLRVEGRGGEKRREEKSRGRRRRAEEMSRSCL
jgi:hypothetical protein